MTNFIVRSLILLVIMSSLSLLSGAVKAPVIMTDVKIPDLEMLIPNEFEGWSVSPLSNVIRPTEVEEEPGTTTLYRTYQNALGVRITLVVAYGTAMGDAVRLHQPEICYQSHGYEVQARDESVLAWQGQDVPLLHMKTANLLRTEMVSYWMRTGARYTKGQASQQFQNILTGSYKGATSTLVRISASGTQASENYDLHKSFAAALLEALSPEAKDILLAQPDKVGAV